MSLLSPLMPKMQVLAELNIGEQGLTKLRNHPTRGFPKPVRIGLKLYWRRDQLEDWLKNYLPKK